MSKLIAIPLLLAATVGLCWAIPGLFAQDHLKATFSYWLAAPAFACGGAGLCILVGVITLPRKKMHIVPIAGIDEVLLLPQLTRKERMRNAMALLVIAAVPAALLACYLGFAARPVRGAGYVLTAVGGVLFLQTGDMFRRGRSMRAHGDLRLTLAPGRIRLDEPFQMCIEIDAVRPLYVTELRARILCFEHALLHSGRFVHLTIRQRNEIIFPLAGQTTVAGKQTLSGSAAVILDSIQYPPSGPWAASMYPFYRWEIRVELVGNPSLAATYPLTVERSVASSAA